MQCIETQGDLNVLEAQTQQCDQNNYLLMGIFKK